MQQRDAEAQLEARQWELEVQRMQDAHDAAQQEQAAKSRALHEIFERRLFAMMARRCEQPLMKVLKVGARPLAPGCPHLRA